MADGNLLDRKESWIDPRIRDLELRDTEQYPHLGGDHSTIYPDCARS